MEVRSIEAVIRALNESGVHYVVVGGLAINAHGYERLTARETWRREKSMLVLKLWSDIHRRTPLDVFVYEPFDFEASLCPVRAATTLVENARTLVRDLWV